MRLLGLLRDEHMSDADIEKTFRSNGSLNVKLLRAVDSAAVGGRGIKSIRQAIRLQGRAEMSRWLALMLVDVGERNSALDDELMHVVMRRAWKCEDLAERSGLDRKSDAAFLVGHFSLLDAVLKPPMQERLAGLDLAPELSGAIAELEGDLDQLLVVSELSERREWRDVVAEAMTLRLEARRSMAPMPTEESGRPASSRNQTLPTDGQLPPDRMALGGSASNAGTAVGLMNGSRMEIRRFDGFSGSSGCLSRRSAKPVTSVIRTEGSPSWIRIRRAALARSEDSSQLV